ncbi:MAG: ATP-binding cassette domain-containing protein [Streptosporangiaceae bacterium]
MGDTLAIEAEGLAKKFGKTNALAGLDLRVPRGSVYGMLGPNGAGKTTAVRVLATLLRPDAGSAQVLGADVVTEASRVRESIGLTGQYAALDNYLTGRANLVMIGELSRMPRREAKRRADELLEQFDLTEAAGRAVKTYSGGMQRRLDLAASLIARPDLVFLDEPTTGLDPRSRNMLWDMIRELAAEGRTLLLTTQYLEEADQLADRIAVVDTGKVIAEGTADELKSMVGSEFIEVTLMPGADLAAAAAAVKEHATGNVDVDTLQHKLTAPVSATGGMATALVRTLDRAGVRVDSLTVHRPSLNDVFLALTGHEAEPEADEAAPDEDGDRDLEGAVA